MSIGKYAKYSRNRGIFEIPPSIEFIDELDENFSSDSSSKKLSDDSW